MGWWASNNISFTKEVHPSDEAMVLMVVKNYFPDWISKETDRKAQLDKESQDGYNIDDDEDHDELDSCNTSEVVVKKRTGGAVKGKKNTAGKTESEFEDYVKAVDVARSNQDIADTWNARLREEAVRNIALDEEKKKNGTESVETESTANTSESENTKEGTFKKYFLEFFDEDLVTKTAEL